MSFNAQKRNGYNLEPSPHEKNYKFVITYFNILSEKKNKISIQENQNLIDTGETSLPIVYCAQQPYCELQPSEFHKPYSTQSS